MAKLAVYDPSVIHDYVAAFAEALDGHQRAVTEPMLAVFCGAAGRDADTVAHGQCKLCRPVCLKSLRKIGRDLHPFAYDHSRSFFEARRILMELDQISWIIFGCV